MPITYDPTNGIFHLQAADTSYVMKVLSSGTLAHLYWGRALRGNHLSSLLRHFDKNYRKELFQIDFEEQLDQCPCEYPSFGSTDFRPPAIEVRAADGSSLVDLRYSSHTITRGKPRLPGLPATYVEDPAEADTLHICLHDRRLGLEVCLSHTIYRDHGAVARSLCVTNRSLEPIRLERVLSFVLDLKHHTWDILSLSGSWARERAYHRQRLSSGNFSIESTRGTSSHQQSPFLALAHPEATELTGDVYGFSLVYSGNFLAQVAVDQFDTTRLLMGINPFDFSWQLEPGASFQAPEVIGVASSSGLEGMSRTFHDLYRSRLARGRWRDRERPILVNNWEATYFDFNAEKLLEIARVGAELGVELFVLDDGWFKDRNRDNSSLGDWVVDRKKLPEGLQPLARKMNEFGLSFGLWIEPEMISPDSDLYRAHPDYCLHVKNAHRTQLRNQLVLDLTRPEVRDRIVEAITQVLEQAPISYVKWDMNRPLTELGSPTLPAAQQREVGHRYVLGVYEMMERITSRFPDVLFESCSGGGGRFDGGILYYMPQTWASDNMDPKDRLRIQWSTSLVFPPSSIGAHVCSSPNHITGRTTPLATRGAVAMAGAFGYELDLTRLTEEERQLARAQISLFKSVRDLVQFGDLYRLCSPYTTNAGAFCYVSRDRARAFVVYVRLEAVANSSVTTLRLRGLDPDCTYHIVETGEDLGGDQLMYAGIALPSLSSDLASVTLRLEKRPS